MISEQQLSPSLAKDISLDGQGQSVHKQLCRLLQRELVPVHMELIDQSDQHGGNRQETHFKLILVSNRFSGMRLVQRHQFVYQLAQEFIGNPIHALAMHLFTVVEWQTDPSVAAAPSCLGGSHAHKR